jgi:ABC-type nitrate/sulfonate/bicarbonate transport system permease component
MSTWVRPTSRALADRPGLVYGVAGIVAVCVLGQLLVGSGLLGEYVPTPLSVASAAVDLLGDAAFWAALAETMKAWAWAVAIATVAGTVLGAVLGASEWAYRFALVTVETLRPVPPVALIPPAILVFGLEDSMKIAVTAFGGFWIVLLYAMQGVRDVDRGLIDSARTLQISRLRILLLVVARGAMPSVASAVRIVAALSLVIVLAAELVGSPSGVGAFVRHQQETGRKDLVDGAVLIAAVLGLVLNLMLSWVERRYCFWADTKRRQPSGS